MGQQRPEGGDMAEGRGTGNVISTLAKLAITAAVIAFIVWRLGWERIVDAFSQADYRWVAAGLGLFIFSGILGTIQWLVLLKNKHIDMRFGRAFSLYFIGMFFNNFLFGTIAGDAVKVALIKSSRASLKAGFAATFLDRFAGLMAMAVLAMGGSAVLLKRGLLGDGRIVTAVLALSATFALFCGVLLFVVSQRIQKLSFKIVDNMPLPAKEKIRSILGEIVLEVHDRHIIAPVAVLSLLIQLLRIGVHIFCAASLGLLSAANFQYFFIFVPVLAMLMVVPLPFGVKEGVGGSLFLLAGFSPETPQAPIVMEFLASLVGIAASLLGGLIFITQKLRKP
jgi:uncharacterized protein (TIRG00374 family)